MKEKLHNLKQTISFVANNVRRAPLKTTISKKVFITFIIILFLISGIALVTQIGYNDIVGSLDRMEQEAVKRGASGNLRFSIAQMIMAPNDYIITEKEFYRQEFKRLSAKVDEYYKILISLPLTGQEKQFADEIKLDIDSIKVVTTHIFSIPHPKSSSEAVKLMEIMDYRFGDHVNKKTTEIFDLISQRVETERILSAQNKEHALNIIYGVSILIFLIIIVMTFIVEKQIAIPIKEITKAADEIAKGNYSFHPVVKTHDEISILAKSFVMMSEAIQESNRELKESEKRYHNLFETTSDLIQTMTPDGRLLYANRAWQEKFGYAMEELKNLKIDYLIHPDALPRCNQIIQRAIGGEKINDTDMRFVTKEGNIIDVDGSIICLFEKEKPSVITCFLRDISNRKKAEQQIKQLSSVVEQTADCVVITDREGDIQYVNAAFEKETGYSREEALGKTSRILKSGKHDLQFYKELWETILSGRVFKAVFTNKNKNGKLFYEQKTITPLKDANGNITHFVSTAKNITEQVIAEEALISSEAKFSTAFRSSPDAIVITRLADGKIVDINDMFEKMFGAERSDILGKTAIELNFYVNADDRKQLVCKLEKEKSVKDYKLQLRKKSGELLIGQVFVETIEIENEQCLLFVLRDITESQRIENELIAAKEKAEEMNRLKTNFLANMSHEIRTPLIDILGYAEILETEVADPEHKSYSQFIFKSGKRLMETLSMIFDLSRIESNKLELKLKEINIAECVTDTVTTFLLFVKEKGLYLETIIKNKNVSANLDKQIFINIMDNLISNAVKYTYKGGVKVEVDLETENGKEWAVIKVKDTGIGIHEGKFNLIFEEFRQLSEGMSREYEGSGLGLTIAKKFVKLMEGTITVESKVNVGSTFTIKFPSITL